MGMDEPLQDQTEFSVGTSGFCPSHPYCRDDSAQAHYAYL